MMADAAKITIKEKMVFIITFFKSMISHIPRIANIVNNNTQAIRM
jgi:hypothetical protein